MIMINIDRELINWVVKHIQTDYPEDVDLLIGQIGACKTPDDEQNLAFDFFIPATERGNQLSQTFMIEDMGYDLYPISWERIQGIVDLEEPRMIFAFMKGEVIYARNDEAVAQFSCMKQALLKKLEDQNLTFRKALEFLNTAMEIYQTMMFEENICAVRKAAGGIACQLMNAIAMVNGQYLENGYGNLTREMEHMKAIPDGFQSSYHSLLCAKTIEELRSHSHCLIQLTRTMFLLKRPSEERLQPEEAVNYEDLVDWYQEARYTFRRIAYYAEKKSVEDCFLLGCYLQIEFDAIQSEFHLDAMDLLGAFEGEHLDQFAQRAKNLEAYLMDVLQEHQAAVRMYQSFDEFIECER